MNTNQHISPMHPMAQRFNELFYVPVRSIFNIGHSAIMTVLVMVFSLTLFFVTTTQTFAADFPLNFNFAGTNGNPIFQTSRLEGSCPGATGFCTGNDGSHFSQDLVVIDGISYWHNIIGQEGSDFAYEYYTRSTISASAVTTAHNNGQVVQAFVATSPDYGGTTDFGGTDPCEDDGSGWPTNSICANAIDPLDTDPGHDYNFSGTGTGNPSRMAMRMVVSDGPMTLEVYKPRQENKPLITQAVIDGDLRSEFVTDMRGLSYSDSSSAAPVSNRQAIDDATMPTPGAGNFDMSMVQDSNITAGRFVYSRGSGWDSGFTSFGEGTYTYVDDTGFDPLNTQWEDYFNLSDNVGACAQGHRTPASCPP